MADVLIAGGGVAGSILAILLARAGLTVELYERGRFPREKPCGEGIMPSGVAVLERLGLVGQVGGAPFYGIRYYASDLCAAGYFPAVDGVPATGRGQRRVVLDRVLFDVAATTPGVSASTGVCVDAPLWLGSRVAGFVVEGEARRAPLVVAADGLRSSLRRQLGLDGPPGRRQRLGVRAHFRLAPGQTQPPWVEVHLGRGYELYVTPLPQNEILVAALAERRSIAGSLEAAFRCWLGQQRSLLARLEGAEQLTSLMGRAPLMSNARAGVTPGAVLLGDAAGFLDPITGGGIAQALMTAELLAQYVPRMLEDGDVWLWRFERARSRLLRDYRLLTRGLLGLALHPWLARQTLRLLRTTPGLFSHLLCVAGSERRLLHPPFRLWTSPTRPKVE